MNRPRVIIYAIASLDGRLTLAPDVLLLFESERWNAAAGPCEETEKQLEMLKSTHQPQAILEGSGSFVSRNESSVPFPPFDGDPTPLYEDFLPEDIPRNPAFTGWFTVVNSRGRIRWAIKEDKGLYLLNLVSRTTPPPYLAYLRGEHIPYIVAGEERVDLCKALEKLKSNLGVTCVLSTAGGMLNGALIRAGLVDEINVEFFPAVIGGFKTPKLFDSPELHSDELPVRLSLISATVLANGHVWLRYNVLRNEMKE